MGFLSNLQKYAGSWSVSRTQSFSEVLGDEKNMIVGNVVQQSKNYPDKLCVCLMLTGGFKSYVSLSNDSNLKVGDSIDIESAKLLTLSKPGEDDIQVLHE